MISTYFLASVYLLCRALEDKRISSWWMVDLGEDDQVSSITSLSITSFVLVKTHAVQELHNLSNRKFSSFLV